MPDYYAFFPTTLSYSDIFLRNPQWKLDFKLRIAFRKLRNVHLLPFGARAIPEMDDPYPSLEIKDLPISIQGGFQSHTAVMERNGFRAVSFGKADTIGYWVDYAGLYLSGDNSTLSTFSALRNGNRDVAVENWNLVFRTELEDGTILFTGRAKHLHPSRLNPRFRWEVLPEDMSVSTVAERHQERLQAFSHDRILFVTEHPVLFMRRYTLSDMQTLFASKGYRKLTAQEEEQLRAIKFDFD